MNGATFGPNDFLEHSYHGKFATPHNNVFVVMLGRQRLMSVAVFKTVLKSKEKFSKRKWQA
jgi:hypothetical protein